MFSSCFLSDESHQGLLLSASSRQTFYLPDTWCIYSSISMVAQVSLFSVTMQQLVLSVGSHYCFSNQPFF